MLKQLEKNEVSCHFYVLFASLQMVIFQHLDIWPQLRFVYVSECVSLCKSVCMNGVCVCVHAVCIM